MAVRFGEVMREPVTTTSSSPADDSGAVETAACCDQAAGATAVALAAANAARIANCNLRLIPICCPLNLSLRSADFSSDALACANGCLCRRSFENRNIGGPHQHPLGCYIWV